jgi:hypothetical protein
LLLACLNEPRHIFDQQERKNLQEIVYEGIPHNLRGWFWSKCSGLEAYKENYCQDYYQELVKADANEWEQFPSRDFS